MSDDIVEIACLDSTMPELLQDNVWVWYVVYCGSWTSRYLDARGIDM